MKKILVAYWSGTGNTEMMAKQVAKGAEDAGAEVSCKTISETSVDMVKEASALAFGCPAMGAEVLEENEMEPFIAGLSQAELGGKPTGLFGSYDWGDGQWMRDWAERMQGLGAALDGEGIITQLAPSAESLGQCYELGKRLAG
ncbi:MAG: flavodoxin [Spirochaetaceae bacterium]|jgi:flavodoxin short chain|nr:flavodoxin [Spirochaetaceae bacterium]